MQCGSTEEECRLRVFVLGVSKSEQENSHCKKKDMEVKKCRWKRGEIFEWTHRTRNGTFPHFDINLNSIQVGGRKEDKSI